MFKGKIFWFDYYADPSQAPLITNYLYRCPPLETGSADFHLFFISGEEYGTRSQQIFKRIDTKQQVYNGVELAAMI